jgi:hypothetical protein
MLKYVHGISSPWPAFELPGWTLSKNSDDTFFPNDSRIISNNIESIIDRTRYQSCLLNRSGSSVIRYGTVIEFPFLRCIKISPSRFVPLALPSSVEMYLDMTNDNIE